MPFFDPLKRVQRLKRAQPGRKQDDGLEGRIPPGQYVTQKFPVLTYGETPRIETATWRLEVRGLVDAPLVLDWDAFRALPRRRIKTDIHCVTRWSMLDTEWEGVPFTALAKRARPLPEAKAIIQHAYGGYTTNMRLDELLDEEVLLADTFNGEPLERAHGGPLRLVVPKLYFWKSAKWLNGLEFVAENAPGFWEKCGYHMHGDPWQEERFGRF